jgi:hypothetical protein
MSGCPKDAFCLLIFFLGFMDVQHATPQESGLVMEIPPYARTGVVVHLAQQCLSFAFTHMPPMMTRCKSSTKVAFFGDSGRRHDGVIETAPFAEDGLANSQSKGSKGHIIWTLKLSVETGRLGRRSRRRNSVFSG